MKLAEVVIQSITDTRAELELPRCVVCKLLNCIPAWGENLILPKLKREISCNSRGNRLMSKIKVKRPMQAGYQLSNYFCLGNHTVYLTHWYQPVPLGDHTFPECSVPNLSVSKVPCAPLTDFRLCFYLLQSWSWLIS